LLGIGRLKITQRSPVAGPQCFLGRLPEHHRHAVWHINKTSTAKERSRRRKWKLPMEDALSASALYSHSGVLFGLVSIVVACNFAGCEFFSPPQNKGQAIRSPEAQRGCTMHCTKPTATLDHERYVVGSPRLPGTLVCYDSMTHCFPTALEKTWNGLLYYGTRLEVSDPREAHERTRFEQATVSTDLTL
jgi:hypothetical protein